MELYEYINESGVFKIDKMGILWEFVADENSVLVAKRTHTKL